MSNGQDGRVRPRVLIVEARFYEDIADALVEGATAGAGTGRCRGGAGVGARRLRDSGCDRLCAFVGAL